ncbi:MAG: RidA family protein [Clostridiales bacterium]|nr:RidA family protein [Clostridiales bacterium]
MLKVVHTDSAPKAVGPYSQAIKAGNFIYLSGQLAIDPKVGKIVEGGVQAETRQALINAKEVLKSEGYELTDVVKTTVFLDKISDFVAMNEIYAEFFVEHKPARAAFEVAALPLGANVEIQMVAYKE